MNSRSTPLTLRSLALRLGVLIAFALVYVHQPPSRCPTALSRLDLLHAITQGTARIDAWHTNTPDKAEHNGHYYSDKAPGTIALAFPAFVTGLGALKVAGIGLESDAGWLLSSWFACAGSIGLVAALGAAALFEWLSRHLRPTAALVTTVGTFLGAAPLPYATMMFSHALVVGLIAISIWALVAPARHAAGPQGVADVALGHPDGRPIGGPVACAVGTRRWPTTAWGDALAGFACGSALASEYTAGLVVAGIFLWLSSAERGRAFAFCVGGVGPLLLIPAYSWMCFGRPFLLPYSLNASFPEMQEGLYAIKWPQWDVACKLVGGPTRGLLFWSPVLSLALYGYWKLIRENTGVFWLTYAVPALQVLVISGRSWDWEAGPTLGPRYLAPILPLLALPCGFGAMRFPRLAMVLVGYSVVITTVATLTDAAPEGTIYNPLVQLHIPLLLKGQLASNLGTMLGLPPLASVAVYYVVLLTSLLSLWYSCKRIERP
jgi:hypothetical protein